MRLFIAADLPDILCEWLGERQEELKRLLPQAALRWTPREQWHVTLRFLGEQPAHKSGAIKNALKRSAEGTSPFSVTLGKPGIFSGPRMGVLWMSIDDGAEPLARLAEQVNQCLEAETFPREKRPFRGHVTMARARIKISSALLRRFPSPPPCPKAAIDQIHLYQSVLGSDGASYQRLHTVTL